VAGLARSRVVVAPAQDCVALSAQASMDSWVRAAPMAVAQLLAELAGFVAMCSPWRYAGYGEYWVGVGGGERSLKASWEYQRRSGRTRHARGSCAVSVGTRGN
jgi:hypothetical protein